MANHILLRYVLNSKNDRDQTAWLRREGEMNSFSLLDGKASCGKRAYIQHCAKTLGETSFDIVDFVND